VKNSYFRRFAVIATLLAALFTGGVVQATTASAATHTTTNNNCPTLIADQSVNWFDVSSSYTQPTHLRVVRNSFAASFTIPQTELIVNHVHNRYFGSMAFSNSLDPDADKDVSTGSANFQRSLTVVRFKQVISGLTKICDVRAAGND